MKLALWLTWLRAICLTLLVTCPHADYCLSLSLFLYLYFVYDFCNFAWLLVLGMRAVGKRFRRLW